MKKAKTDANQQQIVQTFRDAGCSVAITSNVHNGYPDLTVGLKGICVLGAEEELEELKEFLADAGLKFVEGVNLLVEVKDGEKPPSQRKLTPDQEVFFENWKGNVTVIISDEEARDLTNTLE